MIWNDGGKGELCKMAKVANMNIVERARRECQICVKALQNITSSHNSIERIVQLVDSDDSQLLMCLFLSTVVRYGRPFSQTNTKNGSMVFRTKPLKDVQSFDMAMHKHLLHLRNRLMAHDDLEEIVPPILSNNLQPHGSAISIPVEIHVSNKCLGYPADLAAAVRIKDHISAALQGTTNQMNKALFDFRAAIIANSALAEQDAKFSEKLDTQTVPIGGARLIPPELSNHPHLLAKEPSFAHIHNGYCYEGFALRRQFFGPETIILEDGSRIELTPPESGDPKSPPAEATNPK